MTEAALAGEVVGDPAFDALRDRRGGDAHAAAASRATWSPASRSMREEWRPRSEDDLYRYCYHVAGVVGCMMAVVMGVSPDDEATLDRACDLGHGVPARQYRARHRARMTAPGAATCPRTGWSRWTSRRAST